MTKISDFTILSENDMYEVNGGQGPGTAAWEKRITINCGGKEIIKAAATTAVALSIFVPVFRPAGAAGTYILSYLK